MDRLVNVGVSTSRLENYSDTYLFHIELSKLVFYLRIDRQQLLQGSLKKLGVQVLQFRRLSREQVVSDCRVDCRHLISS